MLKEKLLAELEQNRDTVLSGQQLADLFSVSRNAVWKAIKALKRLAVFLIEIACFHENHL